MWIQYLGFETDYYKLDNGFIDSKKRPARKDLTPHKLYRVISSVCGTGVILNDNGDKIVVPLHNFDMVENSCPCCGNTLDGQEGLDRISELVDKKLRENGVISYSECKTTYDKLALLLAIMESEPFVQGFINKEE